MHPVLFQLFGVPIHSYGLMLGLSLVVGWHLTLGLCVNEGMDRNRLRAGIVWIAVSALVGARLLYVATNAERFATLGDVLAVQHGGLVAYGGFVGGFVGAALFCRLERLSLLKLADAAVPSLCTGLILTRLGCYLNGCDFGSTWDGPWATQFPAGSPTFEAHRLAGVLPSGATQSLGVHPTQLYESLVGGVLLGLVLPARSRGHPGEALVVFTMGYAVLRFLIETVRADGERGQLGGLSTSQLIAGVTFCSAAVLLYRLSARRRSPRTGRTAAPRAKRA